MNVRLALKAFKTVFWRTIFFPLEIFGIDSINELNSSRTNLLLIFFYYWLVCVYVLHCRFIARKSQNASYEKKKLNQMCNS
jgi:hypothetical protein